MRAVVALIGLTGCTPMGCGGPDVAVDPHAASVAPSHIATARPAPGPAASPSWAVVDDAPACADVRRRFAEALAKAAGTCKTSADCACFNPVARGLGCGGVTDAGTAKSLAAIEADFHANKCKWPLQCAAWACEPSCVGGRCSR